MNSYKRKALISLISSYASQFATTAANLVSKLVLARLIAPHDLGLYALALMIMLCSDMLVDMGVSQHIAREKHRPWGNVLMLRLAIGTGLFVLIQIAAPILKFWGNEFPNIIRLMSVSILIKAFSGVPNLYLDRELLIHKTLLPQVSRIMSMGLISIVLAYFKHGVWALAWGTVIGETAFAILVWRAAKDKIPLAFTWANTKELIMGSKFLFLISIMGFALSQGDVAVIGSLLPARQVGYYSMAFTLIVMVSKVVETSVFRVIYPMFCECVDSIPDLGKTYRLATLAIYVIEVPIYTYLLFNSQIVVSLLLGEKWIPAASLMQALAVFGMLNPFCTFGNEVLRARKRDDILSIAMVIDAITLVLSGYFLTLRFGVIGIVIAHYLIIGSIPAIVTVYRILGKQFTNLANQLLVVYAGSFAVIGGACLALNAFPYHRAIVTGLLVPVCWYACYKVYGNGIGQSAIKSLLDRPSTEPVA